MKRFESGSLGMYQKGFGGYRISVVNNNGARFRFHVEHYRRRLELITCFNAPTFHGRGWLVLKTIPLHFDDFGWVRKC